MYLSKLFHQPVRALYFAMKLSSVFDSSPNLGMLRYPGRMSYRVGTSVEP